MEKSKVYSERINGHSRTYFMDVRTAENGAIYLVVTDSKKDKEKEGEYVTNSVLVFEKDVDAFFAALGRTVTNFHEHRMSAGQKKAS